MECTSENLSAGVQCMGFTQKQELLGLQFELSDKKGDETKIYETFVKQHFLYDNSWLDLG